jgi:riboflavin synthase
VSENGTSFDLYLIPETLDRTTIPLLVKGENVNIETDVLAKYCEKLLSGNQEGNLMKTLGENGYL